MKLFLLPFSSHCSTQNIGFNDSGYVIKPQQPSSAVHGAPPFTGYRMDECCHGFSAASGKLCYWLLVCLGELKTYLNLNLILYPNPCLLVHIILVTWPLQPILSD